MGLNILVVEDSSVMRSIIIKTLGMSGIPIGKIYEAGNGQEGLDLLDKHWIDLLLLDINMPVMDGEEMIVRLRQNPATADLAVMVVSTESSETRIKKLASMGAWFVHKPFRPEGLRQQIAEMIGAIYG